MIKINLIREGRGAKGAAAAGATAAAATGGGAANLNNILVLGLLAVGVVLSGGYWFVRHSALKEKQDEVVQKQAEAQRLEVIIKEVENFEKRKDSLEKRIATINELKKNQKGPVRIMDRVSQDLPDLVWLDRMSLMKNQVTLEGRGLNTNAIANFVENIKSDPLFEEPDFSGVTQTGRFGSVDVYHYSMMFSAKAETAQGATGATATTSTAPAGEAPAGAGKPGAAPKI